MSRIEFDKRTREQLAQAIARQLTATLDVEVAAFDALDLLDFLSKTLGPHYYNQGLLDAQAVVKGRLDTLLEAVDEKLQPTKA